RHRHQPHRRRAGRRDGYGHLVHFPGIPRPLQRRLRHAAGDGLSGHHHRLHDHPDEARGTLYGATHMTRQAVRHRDGDDVPAVLRLGGKAGIYLLLILWALICLFPIYWTVTTSFKMAPHVMKGALIPWIDYQPAWLGWRSLGLSPETIGAPSTVREEFMKRFMNSVIAAVASSTLAVMLGSLAAYGLSRFSYHFGFMRNSDISFFFLSQLILPPVVLALPFLVLYKELALLDTRIGLIMLYTLTVLPIVIWIMRDQFSSIPTELEEAALVDGLSIWGAFFFVILPIALPGMVASFILSLVLT